MYFLEKKGKATFSPAQFRLASRVGRSAGPPFSAMRKRGKNRQRRGLPPPCGIHPAVWVESAPFSVRPLARWGHMGCMELPQKAHTSVEQLCFYRQGLTLVSRCSQRSVAWLTAVATPLHQRRPGGGNHPAIGPAAQGAWCGGTNRGHSKSDGPNLGLTQGQPRTPGGSLGGNALSGFWFLLTEQKEPPAGSVPTRLASLRKEPQENKTSTSGLEPVCQRTSGRARGAPAERKTRLESLHRR